MHIMCGKHEEFSEQLTPRLQQVIKGIRKRESVNRKPKRRRPITWEIMASLQAALERQPSYFNTMIWAACCMAFFGFLRCSKFTVQQQGHYDNSVHLSLSDVALDNRTLPKIIRVRIKQSKTDPFHQGIYLYLVKTGQTVCPVRAMLPYLAIRSRNPGPLFMLEDERMLNRQVFKSAIDTILSDLLLDKGSFNTHSFRIRAATSAIIAGIPAVQAKTLGRWRSDAYQHYARTPPSELAKLSKQLVRGCGHPREQVIS